MDNERSALRSNKEFSSELQETNGFETAHLCLIDTGEGRGSTRPNDKILACGLHHFFGDDLELVCN